MTDAEAKLANLQKHIHAAAIANFRMKRSERLMHEYADDEDVAAKHCQDYTRFFEEKAAADKAHAASGVTSRDIDLAAQAVLDERGEAHTEVNILKVA